MTAIPTIIAFVTGAEWLGLAISPAQETLLRKDSPAEEIRRPGAQLSMHEVSTWLRTAEKQRL